MLTVLLDLDGTITDSGPGIIASYRFALSQIGFPPPPVDELGWVVGPPSRQSFAKLLAPRDDVEEAVRLYRADYERNGLFDAEVYEGMREAIAELRTLPARLFLCTAKPLPFAERVIAHFGLAEAFDGLYGADFAGRFDDKGTLIAHILEQEALDPARTIMVGDRLNDVAAAARHAIPCVGAVWGYGGALELAQAGAARLCTHPSELPGVIRALAAQW